MVSASLSDVLRRLRRSAPGRAGTASEDRELLERFLRQRDQAAFEILLGRHGPMVLGVCRRLLPEERDAEDAFQATFLVLLQKAASVKPREALAAWLHGVALRTALKARGLAARRRTREKQVDPMPEAAVVSSPPASELREVIDQEVARLPAKLRAPVALCYLEGKTFTEAAEHLGWPAGTVSGRLARARQLLHARLSRRGITLSTAAVTSVLAEEARAAPLPSALQAATVRAALSLIGGNSTALPLSVTVLMQGVLNAMLLNKLKVIAAVVISGFVLVTGAGVAYQKLAAARQQPGNPQPSNPPPPAPLAEHKAGEEEQRERILSLVPLSGERAKALVAAAPVSDKMRKLFQDLLAAAQADVDARWKMCMTAPMTTSSAFDGLFLATKRLLKAERELSFRKADQLEGLRRHLDRMKNIEEGVREKVMMGTRPPYDLDQSRFYRIEAEILLERAKAGRMPAPED